MIYISPERIIVPAKLFYARYLRHFHSGSHNAHIIVAMSHGLSTNGLDLWPVGEPFYHSAGV